MLCCQSCKNVLSAGTIIPADDGCFVTVSCPCPEKFDLFLVVLLLVVFLFVVVLVVVAVVAVAAAVVVVAPSLLSPLSPITAVLLQSSIVSP